MNRELAERIANRLSASDGLRSRGITFKVSEPCFATHNPRRTFGVAAWRYGRRFDYMTTWDDVVVFLLDYGVDG